MTTNYANMNGIDNRTLQKCVLIMNALESGWSVKKRKGSYVFSKKHEGRKEILRDGYLAKFLEDNMEFMPPKS
jgi:predicted RNA binding protein YcfA (HicA-like mRNA interferase family)